jgi:hypothetical protein
MSEQRVVMLEKRVIELEKEIKFLRDKLVELSNVKIDTPGERRQAALERHKLNYEQQVMTADVTCDCCGGDDEIDGYAKQNQPVNLETQINKLKISRFNSVLFKP